MFRLPDLSLCKPDRRKPVQTVIYRTVLCSIWRHCAIFRCFSWHATMMPRLPFLLFLWTSLLIVLALDAGETKSRVGVSRLVATPFLGPSVAFSFSFSFTGASFPFLRFIPYEKHQPEFSNYISIRRNYHDDLLWRLCPPIRCDSVSAWNVWVGVSLRSLWRSNMYAWQASIIFAILPHNIKLECHGYRDLVREVTKSVSLPQYSHNTPVTTLWCQTQ